jgi:hypothetical protein
MKCPLFIMTDHRVQLGEETEIGDCITRTCSWWFDEAKACAVLSISRSMIPLVQAAQSMERAK